MFYSNVKMNAEVACLDVTPLCGSDHSTLCAAGLWNMSAVTINLRDLSVYNIVPLGGGES